MRIATFNVNGVNGRLPDLLSWLEQATPDVACLQELKAPDEKFPIDAIRAAGYGAIAPVVLAGDLDVYKPERSVDDALFRPEVRDAYRRLLGQRRSGSLTSDRHSAENRSARLVRAP